MTKSDRSASYKMNQKELGTSLAEKLIRQLPFAYCVMDEARDIILDFNILFCEMWEMEQLREKIESYEVSASEVMTHFISMLKKDEEITKLQRSILYTELDNENEFEVLLKDDRCIRCYITKLLDSNDVPYGSYMIFHDVTKFRSIESRIFSNSEKIEIVNEKLKKSQEDLALLLNSTAEAIYGIDLNGNCTFCNPSCLNMLGYDSPEELLGQNMHWLIHHSHEDGSVYLEHECKIYRAFIKGEGSHVDNEVLWRKDGTSFLAEYYSYPQFRNNEAIGAVVTFTDIRERKEIEQKLREAKEIAESASVMKSRFLANASHELRSPMNGIMGYLDLLKTTDLNQEQNEYVHEAKKASEMLLYLLNDILDLSKIEAGKLQMEHVELSISAIVDEAVHIVMPKARDKRIRLAVLVNENIPEVVKGDPFRIRQILNNLLSNAVKFTFEGEVSIQVWTISEENGYATVRFDVKDSGIGMDEQQAKKLFDPFTQADASTTRKFGGTGLGLAISKELVQLMGGDIHLSSKLGEGSTFTFTLRLETDR